MEIFVCDAQGARNARAQELGFRIAEDRGAFVGHELFFGERPNLSASVMLADADLSQRGRNRARVGSGDHLEREDALAIFRSAETDPAHITRKTLAWWKRCRSSTAADDHYPSSRLRCDAEVMREGPTCRSACTRSLTPRQSQTAPGR